MRRGLTRCSLGLLLLILPGCARAGTEAEPEVHALNAGVWHGDVAPAGGAPFGAHFHVVQASAGPTIRLQSQHVRQPFTSVVATRDSVRFIWPMATPRHCRLLPRDDGTWRGTCGAAGTDSIDLLLVPSAHSDVPTGLARAAFASEIQWIEQRVGRIHVLVQAGGAAADHADRLRKGAVAAFDGAFALLEASPPDLPFWFFYVDSRVEMERIVGRRVGGFADGIARAAAISVTADGRAPDRHEIMHVAAVVAWGLPAEPWAWINEGLATYAPGECAGAGIHRLAAALIETSAAVPLDRLIHDFWNVDEVSAYLQSASLVGYIRETFGVGAVRAVWREGPSALGVATGREITSLEADWRGFVSGYPPATAALDSARARGCL